MDVNLLLFEGSFVTCHRNDLLSDRMFQYIFTLKILVSTTAYHQHAKIILFGNIAYDLPGISSVSLHLQIHLEQW